MKIQLRWAACLLPLTLALSCKDDSPPKAPQSNPAPTPSHVVPMPPTTNAATPDMPPSQSELDSKASKDIDEKNADAEFEKLKQEIEAGGGGH